ncbi:MAG: sulfurtransferase TusA family protein [Desulfobacterales bacterium]
MEETIHRIDTSGYACPIPLAMVSKKLKGIEVGGTLKVISDDPDFKKQIKIWSYETGNQIVAFTEQENASSTIIRKGSGFKGECLMETLKFVALGVNLHFMKTLLQIMPITEHCGLVFGFTYKNDAIKTFKALDQGKFAVEDIYFEDKDKSYKILNFICAIGGRR